jgi:hypothetical protein
MPLRSPESRSACTRQSSDFLRYSSARTLAMRPPLCRLVTGEKKRRLALSPIFRKTSASVGFRQSISVQRATVGRNIETGYSHQIPQGRSRSRTDRQGRTRCARYGHGALDDLSRKLPGTRVLEEVIQSTGLVVVGTKAPHRDFATGPIISSRMVRRSAPCVEPSTAADSPTKRWRREQKPGEPASAEIPR